MKANEAPEKIYLFENPISGDADDRWLLDRSDEKDVEYIRKDIVDGMLKTAKDLALTVEDISKIISIDQIVCAEYGISDYVNEHEKAMEEVLKRYNESKE